MPWFVCMHRWNLFLAKHGFQACVVQSTMAQSGAQTIHTLLKHISLSILEEEVHAIGELGEATLAWQTCESISFFKDTFFFKTISNSLEIEAIFIFKESFSFKTKSIFKDKFSFFFKISLQSFLFFKILFSFRARLSWDFH